MNPSNEDTDLVFRGLNDPTRRAILTMLSDGTQFSVTQIAAGFTEIGRTAISAHLKVLREAGLVAEVQHGRQRLYRLGPNRAASAMDFLRQVYSSTVLSPESKPTGPVVRKGPGRPRRVHRSA